ncbi:hypothetical protein D3C80_1236840 [compost metagenome]
MSLENAQHLFTQVRKVIANQPRITHHAAAQVIGFEPFAGPLEQYCAKGRLNFIKRLGGTRLGDRHRLCGFVYRAQFVKADQQAQLA